MARPPTISRTCTDDLLSDSVDPVQELHMSLPEDEGAIAERQRNASILLGYQICMDQ